MIDELAKLSPAAQVAAIIGMSAVACVFLYQFYKTIRS